MNLPTILAGPIVRRVTAVDAYIWIVTSENLQIQGELYLMDQNPNLGTYEPLSIHSETETQVVSEHLYISLIKLTPQGQPFPEGVLLGYNLFFISNHNTLDLGDFGYLSEKHPYSLVYQNMPYPTFSVPSASSPATIMYGSCRKPHGKGPDALRIAAEKVNSPTEHPDCLFLMGDQIYTDDVADSLFSLIQIVQSALMEKKS
ncbi:hypothetical protein [Bacillus sp. 2205SS5-2]|uniref:hypothetical protein n=1 Tax=Bacillus sp. 2205SS5-2 TaxID=3109031 RepID=UPI003006F2D6